MKDEEFWAAVLSRAACGKLRPEHAARYWFDELGGLVGQAEGCAAAGDGAGTVCKLRELQAQCERLIGILEPQPRGKRPTLVAT